MRLDVEIRGTRRLSNRLRATPGAIAAAKRLAINRTVSQVRRRRVLPKMAVVTGISAKTLRRAVEAKRAGRRRDFGLLRARYVRVPAQQWGRWRFRQLDQTRALVEVWNGFFWQPAYAFANPAALSASPVPLARFPTSFSSREAQQGQVQYVDLRDRALILVGGLGVSLAAPFSEILRRDGLPGANEILLAEYGKEVERRVLRAGARSARG